MLIPKEVFKPRPGHNSLQESVKLIITNFIVVCVAETLCTGHHAIYWFFWVIIGLLAVYNFFSLRKNLEVYSKIDIISYGISWVVLAGLVLLVYFMQ